VLHRLLILWELGRHLPTDRLGWGLLLVNYARDLCHMAKITLLQREFKDAVAGIQDPPNGISGRSEVATAAQSVSIPWALRRAGSIAALELEPPM
jgi:hypothetical protein